MDFREVKEWIIPEGNVKRVILNGVTLWEKQVIVQKNYPTNSMPVSDSNSKYEE